jgi:membrane-bound lytic murein transglycosylase A
MERAYLRPPALLLVVLTIMIALLLGGCDVGETPPQGLRPIGFAEIEGWAEDDHAAALRALLKSCGKAEAQDAACGAARALGATAGREAARRFFETHYTPYAVKAEAPGLVTGYYEPEVKGSRKKGGKHQVPVYAKPDDLVMLVSDAERARFNDQVTGVRKTPKGEVPYYTRAEIDAGALRGRGLELLWLDDPVELFFMQVQGSGLVQLSEGGTVRLGFAAKNGHPYTSIGKKLVEMGEGAPADMTMQGVKAWLRADPKRARKLMHQNKSYIFFAEIKGDGPIGAQRVALTPGRSLAVDTEFHALGTPVFVSAPGLKTPEGRPFHRLMIAQDVGSAIRGEQRGDIYWGSGAASGAIAGRTRAEARFVVLLPKR